MKYGLSCSRSTILFRDEINNKISVLEKCLLLYARKDYFEYEEKKSSEDNCGKNDLVETKDFQVIAILPFVRLLVCVDGDIYGGRETKTR